MITDNSSESPLAPPIHPEKKSFLFSDAGLGSPLDELGAIFEKKLRTAQNLGEEEKARAYREAFDLARRRLAAALGGEPEKQPGS